MRIGVLPAHRVERSLRDWLKEGHLKPVHLGSYQAGSAMSGSNQGTSSTQANRRRGRKSRGTQRAQHGQDAQQSSMPLASSGGPPSWASPFAVDGTACTSALQWVLHVLGHEMVHAVCERLCPEVSRMSKNLCSHARSFQRWPWVGIQSSIQFSCHDGEGIQRRAGGVGSFPRGWGGAAQQQASTGHAQLHPV